MSCSQIESFLDYERGLETSKVNMNTTDVIVVADVSSSMSGGKDVILRNMVKDFIKVFDKAHDYNNIYNIRLMRFSDRVYDGSNRPVNCVFDYIINTDLNQDGGNTALRDAIGRSLEIAETSAAQAILIMVYTDGEENRSYKWDKSRIKVKLDLLYKKGNITLTLCGPSGAKRYLADIGIPEDNFKDWDGSIGDMPAVAAESIGATTEYVTQRSRGVTSSDKFYADPTKLTTGGVRSYTKKVEPTEVKVVSRRMAGRSIADFYGSKFIAGTHYYQLVKPELLREDAEFIFLNLATNEYRIGSRSARVLLGLPETGQVRLNPGPTSDKFEIFMQSNSINRKVVEGQKMITI